MTPFHSEEKPQSSQWPSGLTLPGWCYLSNLTSSDCHLPSFCCSYTVASSVVWAQKRLCITALSAWSALPPDTHEVCSLPLQHYLKFMFLSWLPYLKLQHSPCISNPTSLLYFTFLVLLCIVLIYLMYCPSPPLECKHHE